MKIINVTKCSKCPYLVPEVSCWSEAFCKHPKAPDPNTIARASSIPNWCPLDNK